VNEEIRLLPRKPLQELARLDFAVFKALELAHRPGKERLIDVSEQGVQRNTRSIREGVG
jgi:hypothetical protein